MGVYEFLRMPYGLCNTLVTFQRLMQNCLGELNLTYTLIYLDDVIVFSPYRGRAPSPSASGLWPVLEHGLKLKLSKCHFLQDQVTFLGHEISADGMKPSTSQPESNSGDGSAKDLHRNTTIYRNDWILPAIH